MPLFKCFQLFWLECWYSRKQHQTARLNSLFSQKEFITVKGEAKHFHQAATGTATYFSSTSVSMKFSIPKEQKNTSLSTNCGSHPCAAPPVINKRCHQDFQSCWNFFYSLQVAGWSRAHRDNKKPGGGQKVAGEGRVLCLTEKASVLMQHNCAAKAWPWSLVEAFLSMLWFLPCSMGLKQHQECKKSLLHHQAM